MTFHFSVTKKTFLSLSTFFSTIFELYIFFCFSHFFCFCFKTAEKTKKIKWKVKQRKKGEKRVACWAIPGRHVCVCEGCVWQERKKSENDKNVLNKILTKSIKTFKHKKNEKKISNKIRIEVWEIFGVFLFEI